MRSTFSLAKDLEKLSETWRGTDRDKAALLLLYQSACRLRDQMRETLRLEDEIERLKAGKRLAEKRAAILECETEHLRSVCPVSSAPQSPAPPKSKR